ncbi:hypothetical protein JTB14_008121 [Gonioctena quinquepunctata]|nr:hypothetical protein JTB14_008121 [Gonioctena quinquepunctata]
MGLNELPGFRNIDADKWYKSVVDKVKRFPLKFSSWRERDGYSWKHLVTDHPALVTLEDSWKIVVPKGDRQSIIVGAHEPATSGHTGVYKTFARVASKYYWPKMRSDIAKFVRNCQICAAHKVLQTKPVDKMISHPKVNRLWEMISTDLIWPLPRSVKGNKYIFVVTDYLSKFSLRFPLRAASADAVIRKIASEVFLLFGVPRIIICDDGSQDSGSKFRNFAAKYQCREGLTE